MSSSAWIVRSWRHCYVNSLLDRAEDREEIVYWFCNLSLRFFGFVFWEIEECTNILQEPEPCKNRLKRKRRTIQGGIKVLYFIYLLSELRFQLDGTMERLWPFHCNPGNPVKKVYFILFYDSWIPSILQISLKTLLNLIEFKGPEVF